MESNKYLTRSQFFQFTDKFIRIVGAPTTSSENLN